MRALLLSFALVLCGCGSPSPSCQPQGQACDTSHLCCGNDLCTAGQCVPPQASCVNRGQTCIVTNGGGSNCCSGLTCTSGKCAAAAACHTAGQSCGTMNDCCQGSTCPRFGSTCALGSIGDPCQQNADCHINLTCNGLWCTKACVADTDCGATNYCIGDGTGAFSCFPFCGTGAKQDCSFYPGTTCTTGTNPTGAMLPVCSG